MSPAAGSAPRVVVTLTVAAGPARSRQRRARNRAVPRRRRAPRRGRRAHRRRPRPAPSGAGLRDDGRPAAQRRRRPRSRAVRPGRDGADGIQPRSRRARGGGVGRRRGAGRAGARDLPRVPGDQRVRGRPLQQHVDGHAGPGWGKGAALTHPLRAGAGHPVDPDPLPANVGGGVLTVNSYHHQGVRARGPRAAVSSPPPWRRQPRPASSSRRSRPPSGPFRHRRSSAIRSARSPRRAAFERLFASSSTPPGSGRGADRGADRHGLEPPRLDDPLQELPRPRLARVARRSASGGPCSRILPASRKQTRSAMSRAKPISWVAMTIVMPPAASSRMTLRTSATSSGSSALRDLVEQQDVGLHRQRPDDRHPLLLAARQPVGESSRLSARPNRVEQLGRLRPRPPPASVLSTLRGAERHVVEHGHVREQVERLEHDPDPPPDPVDVDALGGDLLALDDDPAGIDRLEQVDAAQERRLAAARRADEADDLVLGDVEVDAAQDLERAERLVEALDRRAGTPSSGAAHAADPGCSARCRRRRAAGRARRASP